MTCAELAEDLVALALGALAPEDAARVESHAASCAACRRELAATRRVLDAGRSAPQPVLRVDGEARLLAAVRAEQGVRADQAAPVRPAYEPPPETADLPQPAVAKRRRAARILTMFVPLAAAAAVLVALLTSGFDPTARVLDGEGFFETGDAAPLVPTMIERGEFAFGRGGEIIARASPFKVGLTLPAGEGPSAAGRPAPGRVELTLRPGARVRRAAAEEVELVAGSVDVAAGPLAGPFTVLGGRGSKSAVVRGTRFVATTADERMVVVVREGAVELGRVGGPSETLNAGEQGLVDGGRLLRLPADARSDGDAFLTPRAALAAGPRPLEFEASLAVGEGGPVSVIAFDDAYPNFVVRVRPEGAAQGAAREIKLQSSMLTTPAPSPTAGGAWRLAADAPYRFAFSLAGIGLAPGRYAADIRYMSYRRRGDGAEWLGVVESVPVSFEVPAK